MSDIFLSYNEKDRETVRRLAETFRSVGWSVWWDRRIPAGGTWRTLLEGELQSMRCMVVVWSAHSIRSDWVHEEATEGRQLGRLVPVTIEAVRPPPGFREIQCADLVGWDGTTSWPAMKTLIEDIEAMIGRPSGQASTVVGIAPPPVTVGRPIAVEPPTRATTAEKAELDKDRSRRGWRRLAAIAAALCVVVATVVYVGSREKDVRQGAGSNKEAITLLAQADPPVPSSVTGNEPPVLQPQIPSAQPAPDRGSLIAARPEKAVPVRQDPGPAAKRTRCAALLQKESLGERLSSDEEADKKKACHE